ncbi:hypothetical protein N825_21635 [Skermanella stibiiresistens SB22]|uniref:Uncharacterized protein n=1 Tax=Skermanella stibiiresistens SB22 TaxID=1385369 RepID=W9GT22_9PROT|nr:hypothetical protein N825_21635 [Skermanella stibiiresistens SB22]
MLILSLVDHIDREMPIGEDLFMSVGTVITKPTKARSTDS